MKVRILIDLPKTIDGKRIGPFRKEQEVELDKSTAETFLNSQMAEKIVPVPAKSTKQDVAEGPQDQGASQPSETGKQKVAGVDPKSSAPATQAPKSE